MADLFNSTVTPAEALERLGQVLDGNDAAICLEVLAVERRALLDIVEAAAAVRAAQIQYFRHRDNLNECKRLERILDRRLDQL